LMVLLRYIDLKRGDVMFIMIGSSVLLFFSRDQCSAL
jgi:hypothetical protein